MTFRKIVAAVDPTPAGVHTLRAGAMLAEASGADLVALRIEADPWRFVRPADIEPLRQHQGRAPADIAQARCLDDLRQLVTETIGSDRADAVVRFGIAGSEVARWAELLEADLLILGRQPLGPDERRPAGRTLAGTIAAATVPCLVVPFGQRRFGSVLAVLEAEGGAGEVRAAATAFAALWSGRPAIVEVGTPAGVTAGHDSPRAEPGEWADPVGETIKQARADAVDVLVVGYRPDAATSSRLLERAPCAVLTVPVSSSSRRIPDSSSGSNRP